MTTPRWNVVNVQERPNISPDGTITNVTVVRFRLPSGFTGQVELPTSEANPDIVKKMIEDKVKQVEALQKLAG